ncbi:MAG: aspartate aminotransferase family protein [Chloroflexi bacterium]|nr:aspartate aminotransferase family protein [Chloroflexota bacterium]
MDEPVTSVPDLAAQATHLSPVLGRYFERSWSHGIGHRLYDTAGRGYLDFANGIAVTALGHAHPRVTAAIHAQADRLIGPTGAIGYAEPVVTLARMLAQTLPDPIDTVMFLNSGSEAIDGALKLARRVTGRPGIVAFRGGFHGRTFGATSVTTSNINYRTGYEPLLPGVYFSPFPGAYRTFGGDEDRATTECLRILESLFETVIAPSSVAAILIEPVQGEGGYNPAPAAFLQGLRALCDEHGILLIADEVQTGYGRTGRMWGFEHAGIVPDIVAVAKAIANGLPLSAIATRRELQERWGRSAHGSTYGGNPVACAAGIAVLETIAAEDLIASAARRGAELTAGLGRLKAEDDRIGDVRGPGLMIGVELVRDRATGEPDGNLATALVARAAELGLLVLSCGLSHQVVRWIPPIDVTSAEISEGIEIFGEALRTT